METLKNKQILLSKAIWFYPNCQAASESSADR